MKLNTLPCFFMLVVKTVSFIPFVSLSSRYISHIQNKHIKFLLGQYCNVLGFYSRCNFIALQKVNTLQLNTVSNSSNTRTRPTCKVSEH
jgi:hypothetical protein